MFTIRTTIYIHLTDTFARIQNSLEKWLSPKIEGHTNQFCRVVLFFFVSLSNVEGKPTGIRSMTTALLETANYQDGWRQRHATLHTHPYAIYVPMHRVCE